MVVFRSLLLGAAALGSILVSHVQATLPSEIQLARRQDDGGAVGSNLYNCHDNCGEAILEEEVAGFCNSTIFSTDYAACLQCSGPDNENIWQYYGPYLTAGAIECGSATEPLNGTQADIATALQAQNASTSAVSATASLASTSSGAASPASTATGSAATATSASASGTAAVSTASSTAASGAVQNVGVANGLVIAGLSVFGILVAGLLV